METHDFYHDSETPLKGNIQTLWYWYYCSYLLLFLCCVNNIYECLKGSFSYAGLVVFQRTWEHQRKSLGRTVTCHTGWVRSSLIFCCCLHVFSGSLRDSVQLRQLASYLGENGGRHPDLSSTPLKYQRLPAFTYLPQWTNTNDFTNSGNWGVFSWYACTAY